jgi:uncharacterized protein (TIGR04141 family)
MSDEKIQIGIYKIDTENVFFNEVKILNGVVFLAERGGFIAQKTIQNKKAGFDLLLFYKDRSSNPKWKVFLEDIVRDDQDILRTDVSRTESFILFLVKEDGGAAYAVSGGQGFFAIQEYIDENFGIDIIARLIHKEDRILKAVKERNYVGSLIGTNKFFRKTYNLFENESFGKIYEELNATLSPEILQEKFGFSVEDVKKGAICIAKSSFRIRKGIDFDQLFDIVKGCEDVYENMNPISINDVEIVDKKKEKTLVNDLTAELRHLLWLNYIKKENYYFFDLCHKEFEKYLTASRYVIRKGSSGKTYLKDMEFSTLDNVEILFDKLRGANASLEKEDEFVTLLDKLVIYSYDDDENPLTKGSFISHIFADVEYHDKRYFYLDQEWYWIKDEFTRNLDASCRNYIDKNYNTGLDESWNYPKESEDDYNGKYVNKENTLVLHKVTPENIEACDVLKWDEQNLYLYHVKAGFGNTMRDLCDQVLISAKRILQDKNSTKEYLKKIYDELRNKKGCDPYFQAIGKQTENYTKKVFVDLFKKNLVFVLAVMDTSSSKKRDIRNVEKFGSNIAKFSLQELAREMRGMDVDLKIAQIWKN